PYPPLPRGGETQGPRYSARLRDELGRRSSNFARLLVVGSLLTAAGGCALTADEVVHSVILPEQRTIDHRDPSELPPARIPQNTPPRTVQDPQLDSPVWRLSLDEALRISLE